MLNGADFSHHNGTIDFKRKHLEGIDFCSLKATEGIGNIDPMFKYNWDQSEAAGIVNCAYHFFHPAADAKAQAAHFIKVMGRDLKGHLPPLFDFEVFDGMGGKVSAEMARICVQEIEDCLAVTPLFYGSPGFIDQLLGGAEYFKECPLWVAHYARKPRVPKPWANWTFWQTSDKNGWDMDVFNGGIDDLEKLVIK